MPYINKADKEYYHNLLDSMDHHAITEAGELNFLFTELIKRFISNKDISYRTYNQAIGALECCKLELYRRLVSPYEDTKIEENGDVYK